MPGWPGVRRDTTSVGEGLHAAENVRYRYIGELGQRVGLARCTVPERSAPIQRIWQTQGYIWTADGSQVTYLTLSSLAEGDPATGFGSSYAGQYPNVAVIENVSYLYGGASYSKVLNATTAPAAIGISAPSNYSFVITFSGTGDVGVGRHLLRARRKLTRGPITVWSNPNAIVYGDCTKEGDGLVTSDNVFPLDTGYTRVVELTPGDATEFYQTEVSDWATSYNYQKADEILIQETPASLIGDYGHEPPPDATLCAWVRGYMFIAGTATYPNRVFWSAAGFPESFYQTVRFFDFLSNGDTATALHEHMGDLWVFGTSSADRYVWATNPLDGERVVVPGSLGVWNQRCLCRANGSLFGWGPTGIWAIEGGRQKHISRPIEDAITDEIDATKSSQFHMVWNPDERSIFCFFVATGDTYPQVAAVLDVDNAAWSLARWDLGITASALVLSAIGQRVLLGDEYGRTWLMQGANDGMDDTADAVQTVMAGSTASYLILDAPAECEGAMVYVPSLDEMRRVVDFQAPDRLILASSLSAAPAEGELVAVGGVPVVVETKWWHEATLSTRKQPVGLYIEYVPQTIGTAKVYVFRDFSKAEVEFSVLETDTLPDGVAVVNGTLTIDLTGSGFVKVPVEADTARALKARVVSDRLGGAMRLLRLAFQPIPHGSEAGDRE